MAATVEQIVTAYLEHYVLVQFIMLSVLLTLVTILHRMSLLMVVVLVTNFVIQIVNVAILVLLVLLTSASPELHHCVLILLLSLL